MLHQVCYFEMAVIDTFDLFLSNFLEIYYIIHPFKRDMLMQLMQNRHVAVSDITTLSNSSRSECADCPRASSDYGIGRHLHCCTWQPTHRCQFYPVSIAVCSSLVWIFSREMNITFLL